MKTLSGVVLAMALLWSGAACGPAPASPPEYTDGAPIVNRYGDVVGTADPDELAEVGVSIERTEVYEDGELVGYFVIEDGFVPLDEATE